MQVKRLRLAIISIPLAVLTVGLIMFVSLTRAAAPTPHSKAQAPVTHRFYFPHHHGGPLAPTPSNPSDNLLHGPGPVMHNVTVYAIFWEPTHLQDGTPATVSSGYNSLVKRFLMDVGGTSFYNILTQYYDANTPAGHIHNSVTFGGSFVDTTAFPTANSDCTTNGSLTPTNCIGDSQMQGEITSAMTSQGWTQNADHLFVLLTPKGEDTCSSIVGGCYSNVFCGFHFYYGASNQPYAIMPYNGTGVGCDAGQPSPNNNSDADIEISTLAHELFEAASDPLPNQNWTGPLGEIGDACAYNYGPITLDSGKANELLHGHYYTTQMMWSNAIGDCAQTNGTAKVNVGASPQPGQVGKRELLTATVGVVGSGSTPTGAVTFRDDGAFLGTVSLTSGRATLYNTFLTAGHHTVTVQYGGDVNYGTTAGSLDLVINF